MTLPKSNMADVNQLTNQTSKSLRKEGMLRRLKRSMIKLMLKHEEGPNFFKKLGKNICSCNTFLSIKPYKYKLMSMVEGENH